VGADKGDCGEIIFFSKNIFKMTSINLIILLFIGHFTALFAQQPMVAYRKEGVWYYFDTNGKSMWEPYADVAAFPGGWNNGLLKASVMDITGKDAADISVVRQQVLYDNKGKIVVRPKIKDNYRIASGVDKAGFTLIINNENEHIILCDKAGNVVFESANETCQYLGDGVVSYLKTSEELIAEGDKNHTLYDVKTKKEIATIVCLGFAGNFEEGTIFCHNSKFNWGMVNRQGKMTQPMVWNGEFLDENYQVIPSNTGFFTLSDVKTERKSLLNKNGEILVSDISEVITHTKDYFSCQKASEDVKSYENYVLEGTQAKLIDAEKGKIFFGTGSFIVAEDDKRNLTLIDKTLKSLAKIKSFKYSAIEIFTHHIWTQTDTTNEYSFTCYNEKGVKTGAIEAEKLGKPAYGHVPFMKNNLWGLATESGKVVIKPVFTFKEGNIPDVNKGYWCILKPISDDKVQFDFYNFQGKLVMSTTAEKDGWDYIVQQEEVKTYRNN
jgi:hypothetical protein